MNLAAWIRSKDALLEESDFLALDALSLAWTTYFDYSGVTFPISTKALALRRFAHELTKRNQTFVPQKTCDFMDAFLHSPRYQNVVFVEEKEVRGEGGAQFFAFLFHIGDRFVLAFEGTDTSSLGWKEDFMLTYCEGIPSYPHALAYVKDVMKRFEGEFILVGHSKGGNVASYVLSQLEDDSRILKVYSFEGPGFYRKDLFDGKTERLAKVEKYVPQTAMVGVVLSPFAVPHIVRSRDLFVFQHNAIEWVIKGDSFVETKSRTLFSKGFERSMNAWISNLSNAEKERFTSIFFETFEKAGVKDFNDFFTHLFTAFPDLKKNYLSLSKEDRAFFRKTLGTFWKSSAKSLFGY